LKAEIREKEERGDKKSETFLEQKESLIIISKNIWRLQK